MAKLDEKSSEVKTKKAKIVDRIVLTLLLIVLSPWYFR